MANRARSTHSRPLLAALLCASLLGACASTAIQSKGAPDPYAGTNRALRGHAAIVELTSGEAAAPVRQVIVGSEETTWIGEDGPDSAPTANVRRVIALRSSRAWGWGLLAALVGTAILIDEDIALDLALDVAVDLAFAYLESGDGELPPALGKIVYSAPAVAH